ncbi:MAG: GWxTD domain-containing protein, partial [Terriglobia bacterium]
DPNPATPENEFKIEHYRRIDHANRYFGISDGTDGWRTDRGRIYIQLGEPNQRIHHRWLGEIRPLDLWFYQGNENPSLPNAFYVMFYQRDSLTGWRLYSPVLDGPDKLVTRTGAENDPQGSYRFLRDFNPEIARASMTLLTDEPIDLKQGRPSLASDSLLARIRNLPNDKFTKEMLQRRRELQEFVKSRIIFSPTTADVVAVPLRTLTGESYLHVLLFLPGPLSDMVKKRGKDNYLSLSVSALVRTAEGEKVFQQSHKNNFKFEPREFYLKKDLPVGYEDRLPLGPGEYEIDFVIRNELTQELYQSQQRVSVPAAPAQGLQLSPVVAYDEVFRREGGDSFDPFSLGDYKFVPRVEKKFGTGEKLAVFFQVSDPTAGPRAPAEAKLNVEYDLGSLARAATRKSFSEEILKRDFTARGTVLHGKSFVLEDFTPGSYRLVVKVTDPLTKQLTSQTFAFRVVSGTTDNERVRLTNSHLREDMQAGWIDYRRGLTEAAAQRPQEAMRLWESALGLNPDLHAARNRLSELYFEQGDFARVAAVFPPKGLNGDTDLASVRRYVASFEKVGQVERAIEVAERALDIWGPQRALFEDLAGLLERAGAPEAAEKIRQEILQASKPEGE